MVALEMWWGLFLIRNWWWWRKFWSYLYQKQMEKWVIRTKVVEMKKKKYSMKRDHPVLLKWFTSLQPFQLLAISNVIQFDYFWRHSSILLLFIVIDCLITILLQKVELWIYPEKSCEYFRLKSSTYITTF